MDITKLRTTLLTLGATASLAFAAAAPAAHAQAKDPGGSKPQGCSLRGGQGMSDGQINTYRYAGMRGSFTCTDGTICETWTSTYGGQTTWGSECWESPAPSVKAPPAGNGASSNAAPVKTQAAKTSR